MISSIQPSAVGASPVRAVKALPKARADSLAVLLAKETNQPATTNALLETSVVVVQEDFVRKHSISVNQAVGAYANGNTRVNLNIMPWELVRASAIPEGTPPLYV